MSKGLVFFWFAAVIAACGGTEAKSPFDSENGRDTVPSPQDTADSASGTEMTTDSETSVLSLPERCRVQVELQLGMDVVQFPLSGPGSAASPTLAYSADFDASLFSFSYIESGDPATGVYTAPYRTGTEAEDGGLVYTRQLGDEVAMSSSDSPALNSGVTYGHDVFAVIWNDGRYNEDCAGKKDGNCLMDVAFMRVDQEGVPIGEPIRLTDGTQGLPTGRPAVAMTKDGFRAVWATKLNGESRLAAVSLDKEGKPSTDVFLVEGVTMDGVSSPSIASNETSALVVYTEARQLGTSAKLWAHNEKTPGETIPLSVAPSEQSRAATVAASGSGFLTAWAGLVDATTQVFTRALDNTGTPQSAPLQATHAENVAGPAVAAYGDGYVLAWTATHDVNQTKCAVPDWCAEQVFAALVDEAGRMSAKPVRLTADPNESRNIQLAYDGNGITAVYETWRLNRWQLFYSQMTCE